MADYGDYKKQFDALMNVLDLFEKRYELPADGLDWPRRKEIIALVQGLKWFAKGQFLFFYCGFTGEHKELGYPMLHLEIAQGSDQVQYPAEHVLATILYQIEADIAVIQSAAEQRLLHYTVYGPDQKRHSINLPKGALTSAEQENDTEDAEQDFFVSADSFAQASLWQAKTVANEFLEDKFVLTYLTNSVQARVVPYANVVFIGLPSSVTASGRKNSAIAHEVGHFRFWHSFPQTGDVSPESGANMPDWVKQAKAPRLNLRELFYPFQYALAPTDVPTPPWAEEIFADVYGVLFGGPEYIRSAMELALEHSTKGLVDFDYTDPHPTPLIRPVLMIKALGELTKGAVPLLARDAADVQKQAIVLFNEWKRKLRDRKFLYSETPEKDNDDTVDLELKFRDGALATHVGNTIAWHTRELNLSTVSGKDLSKLTDEQLKLLRKEDKQRKFHAEELVAQAVQALRFVFRDAPPSKTLWGWSDNVEQAVQEMSEWFGNAKEYADAVNEFLERWNSWRLVLPKLIESGHLSNLFLLPPPPHSQHPESLPEKWKEWAIQQKNYFDPDAFDKMPREMYAGDFDTVMNPTTRPSNTWLPIFGAGGWTTEGPCTLPPG